MMIDQIVVLAQQHYIWVFNALLVMSYYLWRRYTIAGNILTITYKGGSTNKKAQKRLFHMGAKALPALEKMNAKINAQITKEAAAGDARLQEANASGRVSDIMGNRWDLQVLLNRRRGVQDAIARINSLKFGLSLPPNWQPVASARSAAGHIVFSGPNESFITFAIGPYSPEPTVGEQQHNLTKIAKKRGHAVLSVGDIEVGGKKHATMTCDVPQVGILKNYSLIFDEIEYLATTKGDMQFYDSIIKTFKTA